MLIWDHSAVLRSLMYQIVHCSLFIDDLVSLLTCVNELVGVN